MRRSVLVFLFIAILILTFLLNEVSTLIALLIEDASADAIQKSELPAPNSTLLTARPQLIPKIIHQTYKTESIPQRWQEAQQSCLDLHQDYEYILWTDAKSLEFIETEYPWFASTFRGYQHPIQRADSIRYFVLSHYGGVYIDLDDGCQRRLDPLLSYNAFVRRTIPTGISNDVMGAIPQHPFFLRVIESLQDADRKWVLPYITIMASTGPLFLSVMWKNWMSEHLNLADSPSTQDWKGRVRVLMPDEYSKHTWSFFREFKGDSWHGKDAQFIFWMGKNWLLLTAAGTVVVLSVGFGLWWVYGRMLLLGQKRRGYLSVSTTGSPRLGASRGKMSPKSSPRRSVPYLWRKWGLDAGKDHYELVEHHDA